MSLLLLFRSGSGRPPTGRVGIIPVFLSIPTEGYISTIAMEP